MKTYNFPVKCNESLYDEAINEYISIVSKYPEVKSIVQIGNVGVAGISDIDLIVYLDDTKSCNNNYSLYQISKKYHHILLHDVFIIPYSVMEYSFLITSIFDTKVVYGNKLKLYKYSGDEKINENLILLNDQAIVSLLYEYKMWKNIKRKDIKMIIARLNSLKYPIILLKNIYKYYNIELINKNIYEQYINDFTKFRQEWFSNSKIYNIEKLFEFLNLAEKIIAPKIIDDIIKIHHKIEKITYKADYFIFRNNSINNKFFPIFTNIFYYSIMEGDISKHLKTLIQTNMSIDYIDINYEKILKKRIELINKCFLFRKENKIYYGGLWEFYIKTFMPLHKRILNKFLRIMKRGLNL